MTSRCRATLPALALPHALVLARVFEIVTPPRTSELAIALEAT